MESILEVWNTALGHLGTGYEVQDVNEISDEAKTMRRFYTSLLKSMISSKAWWWATVFQQLSLQSIYPTPEWPFAYIYPTNCVRPVRIWNFRHTDTLEDEIQFMTINGGNQKVIVSEFGPVSVLGGTPWAPIQPTLPITVDVTTIPILQFVAYTENLSLMPEMFKQALAFILAAYAAPSLPGIGSVDLREKNLALGNAALNQALADDQNQARPFVDLRSIIEKAGTGLRVRFSNVPFQTFNPGLPPA